MSTINTNVANTQSIDSLRQEALDLIKKMRSTSNMTAPAENAALNNDNSFAKLLSTAANQVNDLQSKADTLKTAYELGDSKVNLAQVALASQEAGIGFQFLLNLRNRAIEAYKDIMNMTV